MQLLGGKMYDSNLSCFGDGGTDRSENKSPLRLFPRFPGPVAMHVATGAEFVIGDLFCLKAGRLWYITVCQLLHCK